MKSGTCYPDSISAGKQYICSKLFMYVCKTLVSLIYQHTWKWLWLMQSCKVFNSLQASSQWGSIQLISNDYHCTLYTSIGAPVYSIINPQVYRDQSRQCYFDILASSHAWCDATFWSHLSFSFGCWCWLIQLKVLFPTRLSNGVHGGSSIHWLIIWYSAGSGHPIHFSLPKTPAFPGMKINVTLNCGQWSS